MGLILFGKVVKIHGLSGEIKIFPFSREFDNLARLRRVFIRKKPDDSPSEFHIKSRRFHNNQAVVGLRGVNAADAALELEGCEVLVERADLAETDEGEFYWFELIGLGVYTVGGDYVGRVENLMDRPAQSVLIVKNGEREFLIPMVEAIVKEINLENSRIVISPVAGLLD